MLHWLKKCGCWLLLAMAPLALPGAQKADNTMKPLSPEEARIILHKGTEAPFSGAYDRLFEDGLYRCRQCGAALFASQSKFEAGCGWPAFDSALPAAVKARPDADGRRTEIVCARCGGHLGHVFTGEGFTPKDTRHCVNSLSMDFVPAGALGYAVVAGGCFWGVEALLAAQQGVLWARSGYTGGRLDNPTYEQVCTGRTGHFEAVEVCYDRRALDYETLLKLFFEIHDFSQADGQGPDIGPQYRSAVFYADPAQKKTAESLIERLRARGHTVATALLPRATFYPAENAHQRYYERTGKQPYCHARRPVFGP